TTAPPPLQDLLESLSSGDPPGKAIATVLETGAARRLDPGELGAAGIDHEHALLIPLCHGSGVHGVLALLATGAGWSATDVALLEDLGLRIGTLIDHARV